MSTCEGGLLKIANVPHHILGILREEVNDWDYVNDRYKFDQTFGWFKSKNYHVDKIKHKISYPVNMTPVIEWIQSVAGKNQKIVRCFLNLMEPNQSFYLHVDTLQVHLLAKRFHIPVVPGVGCTYYTYTQNSEGHWNELQHHMEYGYLYQLDNIRPHNVKNKNGYRINFICDVIDQEQISDNLTLYNTQQSIINQNLFKHGLIVTHSYP
jgi:hypothetical protein